MEEIKVGEYVRTNKGYIGKLIEIRLGFNKDKQLYQYIYKLDNGLWTIIDYIIKHSKNIIDLIEAGDFINGMCVDEFDDEEGTILGIPVYEDGLFDTISFYVPIENVDIKTIVTKEKFENESYKVEE